VLACDRIARKIRSNLAKAKVFLASANRRSTWRCRIVKFFDTSTHAINHNLAGRQPEAVAAKPGVAAGILCFGVQGRSGARGFEAMGGIISAWHGSG
jgi:hypothetical protein